jgi:hypothetical protein
MPYTFPAADFDDREKLAAVLGGFWNGVYSGGDLVSSLTFAAGQVEEQTHKDLLALTKSVGRFSLPLYKKTDWLLLKLRETARNRADANVLKLDGARRISDGFSLGDTVARGFFVWQVPTALKAATLIMSGTQGPVATLVQGLDYFIEEAGLWFLADPFTDERFTTEIIYEDGTPVDRELSLWLYDVSRDYDNVFYQFGYALGLKLPTSEPYKGLVNALYDALVEGSTARALQDGFAAIADAPFAKGGETVLQIFKDTDTSVVVTDESAYRFWGEAQILVALGDVLAPGQAISDAVRIFEFNRGQVPEEIRALAIGKGFLATGYVEDIVFQNKIVPLGIELGVNGYTKVSFEIGGKPEDVAKFWADAHAAGVAKNETLAMLLDERPEEAKTTQPTAIALPATINPLGFLVQNILRNNTIVVLARPSSFGPNALGIARASFVRRVLPPQTACLLLVELELSTDRVTMDGPGSDEAPGYEEELDVFLGSIFEETISPNTVDSVQFRHVAGVC